MSKAVTDFLAAYSPEVRKLAMKARSVVLATLPDAIEIVDPPSKIIAYGFGRKMSDLVVSIAPYKSYVNLIFSRGAQLPDPEGLLEGTGKIGRHVKITKPADVDRPAVRALIKANVAAMKRS